MPDACDRERLALANDLHQRAVPREKNRRRAACGMQTRIMNRVQPCECLASPGDSRDKADGPRARRLRKVDRLSDRVRRRGQIMCKGVGNVVHLMAGKELFGRLDDPEDKADRPPRPSPWHRSAARHVYGKSRKKLRCTEQGRRRRSRLFSGDGRHPLAVASRSRRSGESSWEAAVATRTGRMVRLWVVVWKSRRSKV